MMHLRFIIPVASAVFAFCLVVGSWIIAILPKLTPACRHAAAEYWAFEDQRALLTNAQLADNALLTRRANEERRLKDAAQRACRGDIPGPNSPLLRWSILAR